MKCQLDAEVLLPQEMEFKSHTLESLRKRKGRILRAFERGFNFSLKVLDFALSLSLQESSDREWLPSDGPFQPVLITCGTVMNDEQEVFSHCYLIVPLSQNIITVFKLESHPRSDWPARHVHAHSVIYE